MKKILVLLALLGGLFVTDANACQKYFANVQDETGNTLGGVTISVTIYGTTTIATIYSDSGCASTLANPMVSATDGTYSFYAQDGHYSLSFVKTDYTIAPVHDVLIFEPFGINVKSVSEFPDQDNICATSGAIASTSSTVRTIYVNSAVACTVSSTAPSTISWVFLGKGSVTVASGITLIINGPVVNLTDHAVWLGTGTSTFGAMAGPDPYGKPGAGTNPTYSTSMSIDASTGTLFTITPTDGVAFAVAAITRPAYDRVIGINIVNTTGGALGAGTFTCCKASAWTQPSTGFNRWIWFRYNGTVWQEFGKSAADVPN